MGLDTFPLLQNHTFLLTYNNTVFKVKLEYQELNQEKSNIFTQVVSEREAHCQIEDVCRAVLYIIEREEKLTPIQSDNFIIFPETSRWPLSQKVHFIVQGKQLNCHPDLILLKLICKDVAVSDPDRVEAIVSPSKRKRSSDSKMQAGSSNQVKNSKDASSDNRKAQTPNLPKNAHTFDNSSDKASSTKTSQSPTISFQKPYSKQPVLSRNEQKLVHERNTGQMLNSRSVSSTSKMNISLNTHIVDGGAVPESRKSDQVMAKGKTGQSKVPYCEIADNGKLSDNNKRQNDKRIKKTIKSVTQLSKMNNSEVREDENDVKRKLLRKRKTRSESGERQVLQNDRLENIETEYLMSQTRRTGSSKGHDSTLRNINSILKQRGSHKDVYQSCQNESDDCNKVYNVEENTTPKSSDTLLKKFRKEPGNVYESLETSDKDVVEINDDGSVVYESEKMDITSLSQVFAEESPGRKMKNHSSPERRKQLQRECRLLENPYARTQIKVKNDDQETMKGDYSGCGSPAKRGRPRKVHSVRNPDARQSARSVSYTPAISTCSSTVSDELNINNEPSSTTGNDNQAMNHRKKLVNVTSVEPYRKVMRTLNARGRSVTSGTLPRRVTRSSQASPPNQTWLSKRYGLAQSSDFAQRKVHVPKTLKATQQLLEARQHLLESKDGVWLFLRSSKSSHN